jgi:hypothetical protein
LILKKLAYEMFNLSLGLEAGTIVKLSDSMEDLVSISSMSPLKILNNSVENTTDFKIANNNLRSKELLFKLEKSKALPSLNAFIMALTPEIPIVSIFWKTHKNGLEPP